MDLFTLLRLIVLPQNRSLFNTHKIILNTHDFNTGK